MKILSVAYPFARVHPATAGGAEQVLRMLDGALARAGHTSIVVAPEGSEVSGQLIPTPLPSGVFEPATRRDVWAAAAHTVRRAIAQQKPDLVHFHGYDFVQYLPPAGVPVLATLHLPLSWYDARTFQIARPGTWLHCVSRSQQEASANLSVRVQGLLPSIPNGVPEDPPLPHVRRRGFALSLGRICPEKGYHLAFAAAREAGVPFLLAGQVYPYPEHRQYFEEVIRPLCNPRARFIGPVNPSRRRRLLSSAACLLVPSLAAETSSLVAMEAAMCGTPVVAFRSGALPDIVQDGVTGFLVDDSPGMAAAIARCREIDPAVCRRTALVHFSSSVMASRYFDTYRRLVAAP